MLSKTDLPNEPELNAMFNIFNNRAGQNKLQLRDPVVWLDFQSLLFQRWPKLLWVVYSGSRPKDIESKWPEGIIAECRFNQGREYNQFYWGFLSADA